MGSSNHPCHHPRIPGLADPSQFEFDRLVHSSLKMSTPATRKQFIGPLPDAKLRCVDCDMKTTHRTVFIEEESAIQPNQRNVNFLGSIYRL